MRYWIMEVEQRKESGSVLKQNIPAVAPVQHGSFSRLQKDMMAAQAGLGNRYVQRMVARLQSERGDRKTMQPVQPDLGIAQSGERENRTGLPDQLKLGIEQLSGYSMDDVRVRYNSAKPVELNALAYTQGTEIFVGPGQERTLPHEAWHVVQQMQGRVKPTMPTQDGIPVNVDDELEHEADVMGEKAIHITDNAQGSVSDLVFPIQSKTLRENPQGQLVKQMALWVYDAKKKTWVNQETRAEDNNPSKAPPRPWKKGDKFDDAARAKQEVEMDWIATPGEITKGNEHQRSDLLLCIDKAKTAGNLYSKRTASVVGGTHGTMVRDLLNPSARIDVQAPPGGPRNNVQFQVGENSYAGVLFVDTDAPGVVLDKLLEAFDGACIMKSPSYAMIEKKT